MTTPTFWDQIAHQLRRNCSVALHKKGKGQFDLDAAIKVALDNDRFVTIEPMPDGLYEVCISQTISRR